VRILHLSWEYPPIIYGGLGRHVHAVAEHQAALGHDVVVLTQAAPDIPGDEVRNGVRIVRVPPDAPIVALDEDNLMAWVFGFNSALTRAGIALHREWRPDVVHGHDWLVAQAATAIKDVCRTAYVTTIHATEAGRHQGWLPTALSRAIHSVEWWSTYQARRVITCSEHMRWEVNRLFFVPESKTVVIPNGVDPQRLRVTANNRREAIATYGDVTIVFSGRLEWEKGVHTLVDAMREVRRAHPGATVVIAGQGTMEEALKAQVRKLRLGKAVRFTGWLSERQLHALVASADVAVVPSMYEPFGIVALEAAALKTPLVVSRSGGLAEFVVEGKTGRLFPPGDSAALAKAIIETLTESAQSTRMAQQAKRQVIADYGWTAIAQRTCELYERAKREERALTDTSSSPVIPLEVPEGNLLRMNHGT
jgi:glycogen synthase